MSNARPLLLLDVDGVLAPLLTGGGVPDGFTEHTVLGDRLLLSPEHGEWLAALAEDFELVWATSWEDDANAAIAPLLGLPSLPVIALGDVEQAGTWKLAAVARFVADRPVAWIDDALGDDALDWAESRVAPTLLVRTDPRVGLLPNHVADLVRFRESLATGPGDVG
jgi:hypothetical protein